MNDHLKKRDLNVGRAMKMVYDRNEWREFVRGMVGDSPGDEPLTWTRCYSCGLSLLYEVLKGIG